MMGQVMRMVQLKYHVATIGILVEMEREREREYIL
jgi:hypothetical protein